MDLQAVDVPSVVEVAAVAALDSSEIKSDPVKSSPSRPLVNCGGGLSSNNLITIPKNGGRKVELEDSRFVVRLRWADAIEKSSKSEVSTAGWG